MSQHYGAMVVGFAENAAQKASTPVTATGLEIAADLTLRALEDAGLTFEDLNGLSVEGIYETPTVVPSTFAEYLGVTLEFADRPDLGGATGTAMVGRAAIAINAGLADVVVCVTAGLYPRMDAGIDWLNVGASSYSPGSPQAEFEIPYGHLRQNIPYALIAQRYAHEYGYDHSAMAKLVVDQRTNACANPDAIFYGQPLTEDDVLSSRMIATPLRLLEIVRPVIGGGAVIVASPEVARRCKHRGVRVAGYGEGVTHKSPQFAKDILDPPLRIAAAKAFKTAGLTPADVDAAQIYDCYSIAVLMGLEAAGFCGKGEGQSFFRNRDLTFSGDFPLNTNGGQLGFGQPGAAGGMLHVVEGVRQIMGRAGPRQIKECDTVFVSGNGGVMAEQTALVLKGN